MRHPILSALLLAFSLNVSAQSSLDLMSQARLRQMRMMQREAETPNSVKLKSLEVMKQKLGVSRLTSPLKLTRRFILQ